jgi:hypothetical protein
MVFQIECRSVELTTYRYKVLTIAVAEQARALVCQVEATIAIRTVRGVESKYHMPILVSAPLTMALGELVTEAP